MGSLIHLNLDYVLINSIKRVQIVGSLLPIITKDNTIKNVRQNIFLHKPFYKTFNLRVAFIVTGSIYTNPICLYLPPSMYINQSLVYGTNTAKANTY